MDKKLIFQRVLKKITFYLNFDIFGDMVKNPVILKKHSGHIQGDIQQLGRVEVGHEITKVEKHYIKDIKIDELM